MTRVKVCGITTLEDALAAVACGADALGFIFVPESPRYIGRDPASIRIVRQLPPFVSRVAVCLSADTVPEDWKMATDTVQFYVPGGHAGAATGKRRVQAFRIRDESSLDAIAAALKTDPPHALLLDTYQKDKLGGSGQTFDWRLAQEAKARFSLPLILAGGLTPENVAEAIAAVQPYAVDVSSGVEAEPGRKDHAKLEAFVQAVREADQKAG
jgi:phosphoribosylanthranilate isomerase